MSSPDQDLEDFLAGKSDLSRRYRGTEQPPAELDRAILAKAHAAVEGKQPKVVPLPRRNRARWMVPFAVAATVVLSFSIFREAGVETGVVLQEAQPPAVRAEFLEERESKAEPAADASVANEAAAVMLDQAPPPPPLPAAPAPPPQPVTTPPVALQPPEIAIATSEAPARSGLQGLSAPRQRVGALSAPAAAEVAAEDWLRDIRTLREAGQNEEADAALENFLKAYPGYFEQNPTVTRP